MTISSTDEDIIKNKISSLPYSEQVVHLAKAKAEPVSKQNPDSIVIDGDQMCALTILFFINLDQKIKP